MTNPISPLPIPNEDVKNLKIVVFDFDGVFTDNTVIVSEEGHESVRCWRGDGLGLRNLESVGIKSFVLSTEPNSVVKKRCEKLKVPCVHGLADKKQELEKLVSEQGIDPKEAAYVGNDINDLECLKYAGVPIIVPDSADEVIEIAKYQTVRQGGFGAVREICDWIVFCKQE